MKQFLRALWKAFRHTMQWDCPECGAPTYKGMAPGSAPGGVYYTRYCTRCKWYADQGPDYGTLE